jgi:hypothetical protein
LRGEVGVLRRQVAESAKAQAQLVRQNAATDASNDPAEEEKQHALARQQVIAKMGYARNWMMAFWSHAQENEGRCPEDFTHAISHLPDNAKDETLLATNQFEIVYHGSLKGIPNPANVIVLRENQAFSGPSGSGWVRTYGFADGHSEAHRTEDGDFGPWEAQHTAPAPDNGTPGQ